MDAQQVASIRRKQEKIAVLPPPPLPLPPPDCPPEGIHHALQPSEPAPTGVTDEPDGGLDHEEKPKEPEVLICLKIRLDIKDINWCVIKKRDLYI